MTQKTPKLNRIHLLQLLLHAPGPSSKMNEPIRGKTRLQKEMFLVEKKLKELGIKRPHSFRPYIHGPFSRELYNDVYWLEFENVIEEKPYFSDEGGVYYEFQLTPKGIKEVESLLKDKDLREVYDKIKIIKQEYNQMNLAYLVRKIHELYPQYVLSYSY